MDIVCRIWTFFGLPQGPWALSSGSGPFPLASHFPDLLIPGPCLSMLYYGRGETGGVLPVLRFACTLSSTMDRLTEVAERRLWDAAQCKKRKDHGEGETGVMEGDEGGGGGRMRSAGG
ncbi:hypothetical protein VOLCADRAFT_96819 [Volvox carteri f. nagariensis]|uniref:Uncharacterized protein n=1 Tax=Volvox carteri f. nagariensis TaxID=3068 RepID=D8UB53_VOLCA|nr:uncharacterized protein VOLCADRAFT_96819 [Volvox carteri f. nagariensis]EFJ43049.1 hypothetical protein VOLCADRAFT_96819 [Volvox carteri f. nagariensis]|eukprot:XP_002955848.1 hypothetical protein VOLCADRAFT_96819 [Volvox carteri f. nagariensis]